MPFSVRWIHPTASIPRLGKQAPQRMIHKVISGGETGADIAILDGALKHSIHSLNLSQSR
jgi:hypothetical protein